jgi:hypothetical protein
MTVTSILARQAPTPAPANHPLVDAVLALAELHLDEGWAQEPKLRAIAVGLVGEGHHDEVAYVAGELRMAEAIAAGTELSHDPEAGERAYRDSAVLAAQLLASTVLFERSTS